MSNSPHNTELHSDFVGRTSDDEGTFIVIPERSAQTVAELIAESCNARHLIDIVFMASSASGNFGAFAAQPSPYIKW